MEEVAVAPSDDAQVAIAPVSMVGEDGNFAEGWTQGLPEDIREDTTLGTCKNVESMARQLVNAQKMIGKGKILKPTEHSTEEEWQAYHIAGGRPDTAADYKFARPEEFPEGLYDTGLAEKTQELFHKLGLSKKQADAIFGFHNQNVLASAQAIQQAQEENLVQAGDALRSKWGNAFEQRKHYANMAVSEGSQDDLDFEKRVTEKYGNDVDFIELLSNIGAKFAEHGTPEASQIPTPGSIQDQIDELTAKPEYGTFGGTSGITKAQHDKMVQRVARLYEEKAKSEGRAG